MESRPRDVPHGPTHELPTKNKQELSLNERFFRYFQHEITALQEQMERLVDTSSAGGESRDAVDHCLAGISRLSNEVQDASSYVPPYDQRIYAEAIKALQEKLAETRAAVAPRQKFSFKTARKNPSAISLADLAELDAQGRRHIPGYQSVDGSSAESSLNPSPVQMHTSINVSKIRSPLTNDNSDSPALPSTQQDGSGPKSGLHSTTNAGLPERPGISVDSQSNVWFNLPKSTVNTAVPATIASVRRSVINMSTAGQAFAVLSVNDVAESLLLCGEVNGAAHVTGVKQSAIVVTCHQFRMHDCTDVDVYLGCSSIPIIENCHDIRFSHIPDCHPRTSDNCAIKDFWTHVDDFSWLKMNQSPNWRIMDEKEAISEDVWAGILSSDEEWPLEKVLNSIRRLPS